MPKTASEQLLEGLKEETRIFYMGTAQFAVPALKALAQEGWQIVGLATQPDRPVGRKRVLKAPICKDVAQALKIPVYQWECLDTPEVFETMKRLRPTLFITAAYGLKLPKRLLEFPPFGALNLHPSALPKHRGASPIQSAIMAGEALTAASIMCMDEGMDTGDVLASEAHPIAKDVSLPDLTAALAEHSAKLLCESLPAYLQGELAAVPQAEDGASYCRRLCRSDGHLNPADPARLLDCQVRGTQPWPGARLAYQGKEIKILEATWHARDAKAPPGTIIHNQGGLQMATGEGVLELLVLQAASGRKMAAKVCSHNYALGSRFEALPKTKE